MKWEGIFESVHAAGGPDLAGQQPVAVGGGCINEAFRVGPVFIKINTAQKRELFEAEMAGLMELAATETIRVPRPIVAGVVGEHAFLAMEAFDLSSRSDSESQRRLGERLAALHAVTSGTNRYGWHRDNHIGETEQRNRWHDDWPTFFAEQRLAVQFEIAASRGHRFSGSDDLLLQVPEILADRVNAPASLLHGDLWGGNAAFDATGEPVIFDPATYYGDAEAEIAFTEMFGGFGPGFYAGYGPMVEGYERRKPLYNLYHVLNHANLFGGGYGAQAQGIIDRFLVDF